MHHPCRSRVCMLHTHLLCTAFTNLCAKLILGPSQYGACVMQVSLNVTCLKTLIVKWNVCLKMQKKLRRSSLIRFAPDAGSYAYLELCTFMYQWGVQACISRSINLCTSIQGQWSFWFPLSPGMQNTDRVRCKCGGTWFQENLCWTSNSNEKDIHIWFSALYSAGREI